MMFDRSERWILLGLVVAVVAILVAAAVLGDDEDCRLLPIVGGNGGFVVDCTEPSSGTSLPKTP